MAEHAESERIRAHRVFLWILNRRFGENFKLLFHKILVIRDPT